MKNMSFRKVDIPYQYEKYCVHLRLTQRSINDIFTNAFFYMYFGFLTRTFTIRRTTGEGGYFSNSSLPLPPASQTLRHYPGDYCRELTSAHSSRAQIRNLWFPSASR